MRGAAGDADPHSHECGYIHWRRIKEPIGRNRGANIMTANPPQNSRKPGRADGHAASTAEQVLGHAQAGREIVQEFIPLAESLEWTLGQAYLRGRGNKAFLSDTSPVPFVVNNDGALSR